MTGVRAVVFDVFGTLVDWRTSIASALERFGSERGIACDWYAFVDAWRGAYVPSMNRVRSGEESWQNLDELHARSLDELVVRFGLHGLRASERTWMVHRWHELEPWPDVRDGLERLRQHVIVGTLSNGNVALLVDLARYADLRFDILFSAEHFHHYKRDPETYLGAAAYLGLEPYELMLAAAHNDDLAAATKLGLRTCFIARPSEYGPSQTVDIRAEGAYDVVVESVGQLAEHARAIAE